MKDRGKSIDNILSNFNNLIFANMDKIVGTPNALEAPSVS